MDTYQLAEEVEMMYKQKCNSTEHVAGFYERATARGARGAIKTGFNELDRILEGGMYGGQLYFIGGMTSIGKTAFMLQIADNVAAAGHDVLYISLEMSHDELIARTLSRLTCERFGRQGAVTATQAYFWRGKDGADITLKLSEVYDRYVKEISPHHYVYEGSSNTDIEVIKELAKMHTYASQASPNGMTTPVIFVDYLQIISPTPYQDKNGEWRIPNLTDKQKIDKIAQDLKVLARDLDTPVITVSAFNRSSYNKGADYSSFKESGTIEYGCDVLIGLQYAGIDDEPKNADKEIEKLNDGEFASLEAKILKNRYGKKKVKCDLRYNAAFNTYVSK